jgi:hypothetical protein
MATPLHQPSLEHFLQPLHIDVQKWHALARSLCATFTRLAKESQDQFLPTPISDSVLRPEGDVEGRYELAHFLWRGFGISLFRV